MLKKVMIFFVSAFLLNCLFLNNANAKTRIDVKSKMEDKIDITAAKNGIISYLKSSKWAKVVEVGEDYSLWIKAYEKNYDESFCVINLTLELRTASMFTDGKLIEKKIVNVTYSQTDEYYEEVLTQAPKEKSLLTKLLKDEDDPDLFVEALVVGKKCEAIIKEMVKQAEK